MSIETLTIILPAFVAGLLIIATHVPLGMEVMKRGIIFIDLAVAQIAGLGVIVAYIIFHAENNPVVTQLMAFIFAITAAYGFKYCERYMPNLQEAIIGSMYVFSSSMALLLLANHPHGSEHVENLLSGQLLWVSWQNIAITAAIYAGLLFIIFKQDKLKQYFYFIFAIAITISVQLAGVFLVFASLIIPAIASAIHSKGNPLIYGYMVSVIALVIGLLISLLCDLPTGPVLVCSLFMSLPATLLLQIAQKKNY